jgi:PAS domain S-box-containing protein
MLAGGMMLAVSAALGWVALLRRQVRNQTKLIRQKLEDEAALEERYRALFENATDMLYTHDREGRITSSIKPENASCKGLAAKCSAATSWSLWPRSNGLRPPVAGALAQRRRHAQHGMGRRRRLRRTCQTGDQRALDGADGHELEIEGIARDITERKRLEREILEISNREQRRIGHDLHDGVCQQLAGIAFLTSTLAKNWRRKASLNRPRRRKSAA